MFLKYLLRQSLGVLVCVLALAPQMLHAQSKEYQVKAAFLFNFAQFVEWPDIAYSGSNTSFCIGVLGDDPFGTALDQTVRGETIGDHKMTIRRAQQITDLQDCQMIFVCKSEKSHTAEILSALGSKPVLTVGESDGFARSGGGVNFYLDGARVRFEINPAAARNAGLKVSSQLLSLGRIVAPAREEK